MIGLGYVGLRSGACFVDFSQHAVCVDKDQGKIGRQDVNCKAGPAVLVNSNANIRAGIRYCHRVIKAGQ